jgi:hypothetical protein
LHERSLSYPGPQPALPPVASTIAERWQDVGKSARSLLTPYCRQNVYRFWRLLVSERMTDTPQCASSNTDLKGREEGPTIVISQLVD